MNVYDLENCSVTAEDAKAALDKAAYPSENGAVIHSRAGGVGADWDLASAYEFVNAADEIVWSSSLMRHDLAVRCGKRIVCFDVPRPERRA